MTFAWRRTACRMRHCFARRIVECSVRRKLGCTTTRLAERHPQGVYRIRKAAKPPTAAQQRIIEESQIVLATLTAATPRAGSCIPEAKGPFKPETANLNAFLLDGRRPFSFSGKKTGVAFVQRLRRCFPRARRARPPPGGIKKGASLRDTPFYHPNRVWSKGFLLPFRALRAL